MQNPTYQVNISYFPKFANGQQLVDLGGGNTQSIPTYAGGYFVAAMPEVGISATAADYRTALNSLLIIATSSSTDSPALPHPFSSIRTF